MRTLTSEQTLHHHYAGWLGKLIGVRLGAPVEMWASEQILQKYGLQKGYLKDYEEFAADDDTNGPTFFIRAMRDSGHFADMTAADVAQAWLNYPAWGKGMYWWGGYGISAEHTAYENLRQGVEAPRCGSMELNGEELSEQIGGQIFSDAWGLICPGNPAMAADFSEKAASVSHDGEALNGARFVAACIAAAFRCTTHLEMAEAGLKQIPSDSTYARVFSDVKAFYDSQSGDWQACLNMLRTHYWRDKFGGGCHIIPNAGIMALALYYGQGDFDDTLEICNRCGFDTDCNVGNLGSMMGVLVGLEGLKAHWLKPINDFYACSSVVGALNLNDAANFSLELAGISLKLGFDLPKDILNLPKVNFRLPGSTHALMIAHKDMVEKAYGLHKNHALHLPLKAGETTVYLRTYMRPKEFSDDRYSPAFSPMVYPGQTITAALSCESGVKARLYAFCGNTGNYVYGPFENAAKKMGFTLPQMDGAVITQIGIAFETEKASSVTLTSLDFGGPADYSILFEKERIENWSSSHKAVSQCTQLKGYWNLNETLLSGSCADLGECYTGDVAWQNYLLSTSLIPKSGQNHRLLFRVQGGARAYGIELNKDGLSFIQNSAGWQRLKTVPFAWRLNEEIPLNVRAENNRFSVFSSGSLLLDFQDENHPYLNGQIGFGVANGSRCLFGDTAVRPL